MSASPIARATTQSQTIPSKRILVTDPSQIPSNYSTTPGGTLYSTTPGGTRVVYDRSTLMNLKNSPLSKTPPNLSEFPGLLKNSKWESNEKSKRQSPVKKSPSNKDDHEQFQIDI